MQIYHNDPEVKARPLPQEDPDGTVWIDAVAHDTLTANTPYFIIADEFGNKTAAFSDVTVYCYVGVAKTAEGLATGKKTRLQIGGYCEDMVTASLSMTIGHAIKVYDGTTADVGADYTGAAGEFAVAYATSTTATAQDVYLVPERILTTT